MSEQKDALQMLKKHLIVCLYENIIPFVWRNMY